MNVLVLHVEMVEYVVMRSTSLAVNVPAGGRGRFVKKVCTKQP